MRYSLLLIVAIVLLVLLHVFHFADVLNLTVNTPYKPISLIIRANITPLAWCAYLLLLLGLLTRLDRQSFLRRHKNRFAVCYLWSVPAWCYFDWMNFYFMRDPHSGLRAWEYINLPPIFSDRVVGYLLSFGAIAPGMFLTAQVLQRLTVRHAVPIEYRKSRIENTASLAVFLMGVLLAPVPILYGTPASNLAIWVGTWALLDPINRHFGRPSILDDWFHLRFARTLNLAAAGLMCGLLWEFWNFWSLTKWQYHLPFLGSLENYRYFEMPLLGLLGFPAFALETFAMWQASLLLLAPFCEGEPKANPTPADRSHHDFSCL